MIRRERADIVADIKVAEDRRDKAQHDLKRLYEELHRLDWERKVGGACCSWCSREVEPKQKLCPHCGFVFETEEEEAA